MKTVDEVDALLRSAPPSTPWMVMASCAEPPSYLAFGIGVGEDRVPVHFNGDYSENAISRSDSAEDLERDEEVELLLGGDYVWNSTAHLVDYGAARTALEQFLRSGERPPGIDWEEL